MKVTIKDIARMTETSITTVSLVLNDKPSRISAAKKAEIKRIAQQYNYVPNMSARSLVTKSTNALGLIIPDLENSFFASLAKSVQRNAAKYGYSVIIADTNEDYLKDIEHVQRFKNLGVDGILITVSQDSYHHQSQIKEILKGDVVPFVMVDRTYLDFDCNSVCFDNQLGGYLQTIHAISLGHKVIANLSAKDSSVNGYHRYLGYKKALEESGIKYDDNLVFNGDYSYQSGFNLGQEIFKNQEVSAVVAANDLMIYGLRHYARINGINRIDKMLLVGYDNLALNSMVGIGLDSVEQDVHLLGSSAVDLMIKAIKNRNNIESLVLKPRLSLK